MRGRSLQVSSGSWAGAQLVGGAASHFSSHCFLPLVPLASVSHFRLHSSSCRSSVSLVFSYVKKHGLHIHAASLRGRQAVHT